MNPIKAIATKATISLRPQTSIKSYLSTRVSTDYSSDCSNKQIALPNPRVPALVSGVAVIQAALTALGMTPIVKA